MPAEPEERLPGGNTGGAVRSGDTVRRSTGAWTPAVHAFLDHLSAQDLPAVPRVHGYDEQGREVLDYLPGHVVDVDDEELTDAQLVALVRWTREMHRAAEGFEHPGPWRFFGPTETSVVGHNDLAPYNVCFDGDRLAGVFDWDLAGPSTPLLELGWIAWQCVPLFRPLPAGTCARRLRLIADTYGDLDPTDVLTACLERVQIAIDGVLTAAANGDAGMVHLMRSTGEPEPMRRRRADLLTRAPGIRAAL